MLFVYLNFTAALGKEFLVYRYFKIITKSRTNQLGEVKIKTVSCTRFEFCVPLYSVDVSWPKYVPTF